MGNLVLVVAIVVLCIPAVTTARADLHWLWDNRCAECHGHSGDFARRFLEVSGTQLYGRHHRLDLTQFLFHHYALGNESDAVYQMLLGQAQTPPRFRAECSRCHGGAAEFVRQHLHWQNGDLVLRANAQSLALFMSGHRNLATADAEFFTHLLQRLGSEIYRP